MYDIKLGIIFVVILLVLLFFYLNTNFNKKENFSIKMNTDNGASVSRPNYKLQNILPLLDNPNGYLGTFYNKNNSIKNNNNLLRTNNLQANTWTSIYNGYIDSNTLIYNLCWHRDEFKKNNNYKRLMCIGKNVNKEEFKIYIKETKDIESKWIEYKPNGNKIKNTMISFIIYDLNNHLIGINDDDKQIYKLNETNGIWTGPINFSIIRLKKIIYDWDRKMLGLDVDNTIWKKSNLKWETSEWKKEDKYDIQYIDEDQTKKRIEINDLVHDIDGKLLGISPDKGIFKQINNSYNSFFIPYNIENNKTKETDLIQIPEAPKYYNNYEVDYDTKTLMTKNDILMNKTGIDTEHYDYIKLSDNEKNDKSKQKLVNKLNSLIKFKRKFINICKNRKTKTTFSEQNINLYDNIDTLIQKLDSKGYNSTFN